MAPETTAASPSIREVARQAGVSVATVARVLNHTGPVRDETRQRVLDAAWSGDPAGPASDSDREPADVPLDAIAAAEVGNATSCRAWREQALGWREFYAGQQVAINGKAGAWAAAPASQSP